MLKGNKIIILYVRVSISIRGKDAANKTLRGYGIWKLEPRAISYYPRERKKESSRGWKWEKGIHTKVNETQGFQYLGHSNWTICSLFS